MAGGEGEGEGRRRRRGGKQGRNYYIFCPKTRIAPFAELRDRDSATIADAECRARARGSPGPLLVLTNFPPRVICFNSALSRAARGYSAGNCTRYVYCMFL